VKIKNQKSKILNFELSFYILIFAFCILFLGCDAFVRKFTRKHKKDTSVQEEMVLAPEEYKGPQMTKEELYRQYFLFWKSWHDELIESLIRGTNHKKQIDCANEAIKNLEQLRSLLNLEKQKKLYIYINELRDLKDLVTKDIYGNNITKSRSIAERIKMNILRDFSYPKIKDYLA